MKREREDGELPEEKKPKKENGEVGRGGGSGKNSLPDGMSFSRLPQTPHPLSQKLSEFDSTILPEGFFVTVYGARRTGKTHAVSCLLEKIADRFDFAYLFSSTADLHQGEDRKTAFPMICREMGAIFTGFDEVALQAIITRQEEVKKHNDKCERKRDKKPNNTLIIFDDFVHEPKIRHSKLFTSLPVLGRHRELSVIVLSQGYSAVGSAGLNPATRQNSDLVITFLPRSLKDIERIAEWYMTKEKIENMWMVQSVCREKHQCLCIDLQHPHEVEYPNYLYKYKAQAEIPKYRLGKVQWKLWDQEKKRRKQSALEAALLNDRLWFHTNHKSLKSKDTRVVAIGEATGRAKKQPLSLYQAMQQQGYA